MTEELKVASPEQGFDKIEAQAEAPAEALTTSP